MTAAPTTAPSRPAAPAAARRRAPAAVRVSAALAAVLLAVGAAWAVPAGRAVLRDSFTRLPPAYTELYFTGTPSASHGKVLVPVALITHGGQADTTLSVRVRITAANPATASRTTVVTALLHRDTPWQTTIDVPYPVAAAQVDVDLPGHTQSLHYRLTGQ